ncbi:MAG: GLUG motif-containing protein [Rhizomicrobium sp.]
MHRTRILTLALSLSCLAGPSLAAVTISSAATQNMNCSNGVCAPTAEDAVLNVGDLETFLGSGNIEVTTTGSGVQAKDIELRAALSWSTGSELTLDANESLTFYQPVEVQGIAGLILVTNDGGSGGEVTFVAKGQVTFDNLSSTLTINNIDYTLEGNLKDLGNAVALRPRASYALANDYDASGDGVYTSPPVATALQGQFSGLGNTVSHLTISDSSDSDSVGLFSQVAAGGSVENIRLVQVTVNAPNTDYGVGGLVGWAFGTVSNCSAAGRIRGTGSVGGLVGAVSGVVSNSHARGRVLLSDGMAAGGLAGWNDGLIEDSWAESTLIGPPATDYVGGLVGANQLTLQEDFAQAKIRVRGAEGLVGGLVGGDVDYGRSNITDSYAIGSVRNSGNAQFQSYVGGLMGYNVVGSVSTSYSAASVKAKRNTLLGGFFGTDTGSASLSYWDKTTSRTNEGSGDGNNSGLTGLTTQQLQSGLPNGFNPTVWAENPNINSGLPYLIHNPPPK